VLVIAEALAKLPQGTHRRKLEQAREEALQPFHAAIAQVQEQAREKEEEAQRKREETRKVSDAEYRAGWRLSHGFDYLGRLKDKVEFDGFQDRWDTAEKLKEKIRPLRVKELLQKPDMTDAQIQKRIETLVEEHLESVLAD
jgi:hypothetical protein